MSGAATKPDYAKHEALRNHARHVLVGTVILQIESMVNAMDKDADDDQLTEIIHSLFDHEFSALKTAREAILSAMYRHISDEFMNDNDDSLEDIPVLARDSMVSIINDWKERAPELPNNVKLALALEFLER